MSEENVTLRDHLQKQIDWVDRYFERQLDNAQDAINKAESQLNKRLEGMNEFRDTLKDQAGRLCTKEEVTSRTEALDKRIGTLERQQSSGEGRSSGTAIFWTIGASILSSVATAVLVYIILKGLK